MGTRAGDEFVGQDHIVSNGRLLWRAFEADPLSSLVLYCPLGPDKTTLVYIIANTSIIQFDTINAVLARVAALRDEIEVIRGAS